MGNVTGRRQLVVDILDRAGRVRCTKCLLKAARYAGCDDIAIKALSTAESRTADGERLGPGREWGVLTAKLGRPLGEHMVCIQDHGEGAGNLNTLLTAGIVHLPERWLPNGPVVLPVCRLNTTGWAWVEAELADSPAPVEAGGPAGVSAGAGGAK